MNWTDPMEHLNRYCYRQQYRYQIHEQQQDNEQRCWWQLHFQNVIDQRIDVASKNKTVIATLRLIFGPPPLYRQFVTAAAASVHEAEHLVVPLLAAAASIWNNNNKWSDSRWCLAHSLLFASIPPPSLLAAGTRLKSLLLLSTEPVASDRYSSSISTAAAAAAAVSLIPLHYTVCIPMNALA